LERHLEERESEEWEEGRKWRKLSPATLAELKKWNWSNSFSTPKIQATN